MDNLVLILPAERLRAVKQSAQGYALVVAEQEWIQVD